MSSDDEGCSEVVVIIKGTFALPDGNARAPAPCASAQQEIRLAPELLPTPEASGLLLFEDDLAPYKPRTDILLVGNAYAPGGHPTSSVDVEIRVGRTAKVLRVFGDRAWSFPDRYEGEPVVVGPVPFTRMPLTFARAFGGLDPYARTDPHYPREISPTCPVNPWGRGYIAAKRSVSIHDKALPNIEDPSDLIRSYLSHPRPAGCAFYPRDAHPRLGYAGSYDEVWRAERAPHLPTDFDPRFYNAAHPDLQVHPYLAGNEPVRLGHLTPAGGTREFFLPGLRPVLLARRGAASTRHPANLDTLLFQPEEGVFTQIWRGRIPLLRAESFGDLVIDVQTEQLASPGWPW